MAPIAAGLSLDEMRELALYYSSLLEPWSSPGPTPQVSTLAIERGKAIARHGIPRQRVPACVACHGPSQHADYLVQQLELFNKGHRGGSAYAHLMRPVATRLTHEQMHDVALYYASLPTTLETQTQ
jgi:cytochrome c553